MVEQPGPYLGRRTVVESRRQSADGAHPGGARRVEQRPQVIGEPVVQVAVESGEGFVEEQQVLHVARQDARLDRGANRHDFVGVHALMRRLVDELVRGLNNTRHAGHATDEHEFINLVGADAGVLQSRT